jgi:hypothetical protein
MHTVLKSRGRVREVFAKFWEGGYLNRGCENFGERVQLLGVFFAFLLTSFAKILEGGYTFIPPITPPLYHKFNFIQCKK